MSNSIRAVRLLAVLIAVVIAGLPARLPAGDWPQWRGPHRDGNSSETGLLSAWPEGGPSVAWQASGLGTGYSSVVVSRGRVFTIGRKENEVFATALDEATGRLVWSRKIGTTTSRSPSSTPTVDGDFLYAVGPDGELVCLKVASGEAVWQKNLFQDFAGKMMSARGYGESPLIDGDRLVMTPGGKDAMLVALDKRTGDLVWKATIPEIGPKGRDGAGFSSAVVSEGAGLRQYVQLVGRGVIGVDARDGRYLWGHNGIANDTANIPTPVVHGDYVFSANGYTAGSVLLRLVPETANGSEPGVRAEVVYALTGNQFQNHHGGVVLRDGFLFGGHGNNNGLPTCLDFATGRVKWKRRGPGIGSAAVVAADGHLYFRYQNGVVALIEAADKGYALKGTLEVPGAGGDSWSHPVVANGRLYLREQETLWVHDIRAEGSRPVAVAEGDPAAPPAVPSALMADARSLGVRLEAIPRPRTERETAGEADRTPASLESDETAGRPTKSETPKSSRRLLDYVWETPGDQTAAPLQASLSDRHLTDEGLVSKNVQEFLAKLPGPFVLHLAGTRISDDGLRQLSKLELAGLSLELCSRITDGGLVHLKSLLRLRALSLGGTAVSGAGIEHLAEIRTLRALDLELCDGITDVACRSLAGIRSLRMLVLKKSGFGTGLISNSGLKDLQGLTELERLNLYGNAVTDAGLASLKQFPRLRELDLSLLPITDAGLVHLKALESLERLDLLFSEGFAGPKVTDAGAAALAEVASLVTLDLTGSKMTDAGLRQLSGLERLKRLRLARTRLSADADAREAFRKAGVILDD